MDIIKQLQEIQSDLVGIIIPVIITAIISLISLIVNTVVKISIEHKEFNRNQYKIMQKIYPKLKKLSLDLVIDFSCLEKNLMYTSYSKAIEKYLLIYEDEAKYRKNHPQQLNQIDDFISSNRIVIKKLHEINDFLLNNEIPQFPIGHPILKHKVTKMFFEFQDFSFLLNLYEKNEINTETVLSEIKKDKYKYLNSWSHTYLDDYINRLDKWFISY